MDKCAKYYNSDPKRIEELDELLLQFSRLMGPRQFFAPHELVKMGIYGSKSSVWYAVHHGHIEAMQISDRRWVIMKDSILKHLRERNKDKE